VGPINAYVNLDILILVFNNAKSVHMHANNVREHKQIAHNAILHFVISTPIGANAL
jgi:hypothetical protein